VIVAAVIFLAGLLAVVRAARTAADGFEDEFGFHTDRPNPRPRPGQPHRGSGEKPEATDQTSVVGKFRPPLIAPDRN